MESWWHSNGIPPFNPGIFRGVRQEISEKFHLTAWNTHPPHVLFGLPKDVGGGPPEVASTRHWREWTCQTAFRNWRSALNSTTPWRDYYKPEIFSWNISRCGGGLTIGSSPVPSRMPWFGGSKQSQVQRAKRCSTKWPKRTRVLWGMTSKPEESWDKVLMLSLGLFNPFIFSVIIWYCTIWFIYQKLTYEGYSWPSSHEAGILKFPWPTKII